MRLLHYSTVALLLYGYGNSNKIIGNFGMYVIVIFPSCMMKWIQQNGLLPQLHLMNIVH